MRSRYIALFVGLVAAGLWLAPRFKAPAAAEARPQMPPVTVPAGFTVEIAAAPPLLERPTFAAVDDRGRMFVSDNAGINADQETLAKQLPSSVRLLEDTNGDGVYDKSTVFADKMVFPEGGLWYKGALYVASAPNMWRLEDVDGDGRADKREIIASGFVSTGNGADIHGPFLHPNGRIFWAHGRKGHEVHQKDGTLVSKNRGARIWSAKPDGTDIQIYAGGGMDNPVEVAFTPEGEVIGDVNLFYGVPRGDVLLHWVPGGMYPRYDQEVVLAEFRKTGDPLTEIFNFGHVAVSGLTRYQSAALGAEYTGNIFVSHFNTRKITRSVLAPRGSTLSARTEDFLTIHAPDVHLTDTFEDADGSLMVVDTGGWFRRGCPSSEIAKPTVTGAIYRVRKSGPRDAGADPRGLKVPWKTATPDELGRLLADDRFAVRDRAIEALAMRGEAALAALGRLVGSGTALQKKNAIWALTRMGSAPALASIRAAFNDADETVRQTASNSVVWTRDPEAQQPLVRLLRQENPVVQRTAAAALGRIGSNASVAALVGTLSQKADRYLEHALIYALIDINDYEGTKKGLNSRNPGQRARTLIALDQMPATRLGAETVLPILTDESPVVRKVAVDIATRRPEWAGIMAAKFRNWVADKRAPKPAHEAMMAIIPKMLGDDGIKEVTGLLLASPDAKVVRAAFELIAKAPGPTLHPTWLAPFEKHLGGRNTEVVTAAIDAAKAVNNERLAPMLRKIAADPAQTNAIRLAALATGSGRNVDADSFQWLAKLVRTPAAPTEATAAARFLSDARLTADQLKTLVPFIPEVGPLVRPMLFQAFTHSHDKEVGLALVKQLSDTETLPGVRFGELAELFKSYPAEVNTAAGPALAKFQAQSDGRKGRLLELEKAIAHGDPKKGQEIYRSGKGACITCHQIGTAGRSVGPNLTHIGQLRSQRDLLESVLDPSATIAQGFEPMTVETTSGQVRVGVIKRETAQAVFLVDAATETQIPRRTVKRVVPGQSSLMPEGLDQALSRDEFVNLISYLKSLQ